ncbi:hypothetical protein B0H16DRAFT_1535216 [Mycena metata]|uniref:Bowman-Birk serine protease inhibitors family domain-containing protein n=1 Tax=Mycena metata TaxID=1033252 RepID=A0AAD7NG02_9AGAR|nr:hypothetical protein B0H16DRAFT_1535216 [Mycena metata]
MFQLFSLRTLLFASLAIGVVLSESTRLGNDGCIICTQQVPQCHCTSVYEKCIIIPQDCFECAHAVCLPPRDSADDTKSDK